ncbi:MAG: hypothetical protein IT185_02165 [Acidobacteria bacterium]|nr:hypothetical protein [Acidobacteriota bacterium]
MARLKRVLSILEVAELPRTATAERLAALGISRTYRGADLVVKLPGRERLVRGIGAPVHLLPIEEESGVPDGGPAHVSKRPVHEWEQEWEDAQIDAEDTIVAIEALAAEVEGWIDELQAYSGFVAVTESTIDEVIAEGDANVCTGSDPSDVSLDPCSLAISGAVGEAIVALGQMVNNSEVVKAALANARNAIGVAMVAYQAGTITMTGLAEVAVGVMTALAGTKAGGWIIAAGVAVLIGTTIAIIYEACYATPTVALG